jgi:hypothetical protein
MPQFFIFFLETNHLFIPLQISFLPAQNSNTPVAMIFGIPASCGLAKELCSWINT